MREAALINQVERIARVRVTPRRLFVTDVIRGFALRPPLQELSPRTAGAAIMEPTADIALIGLAVMGQNLIMDMNDHGYKVVAYNRTTAKVDEFLQDA